MQYSLDGARHEDQRREDETHTFGTGLYRPISSIYHNDGQDGGVGHENVVKLACGVIPVRLFYPAYS